jgi:hypothetical protein
VSFWRPQRKTTKPEKQMKTDEATREKQQQQQQRQQQDIYIYRYR